VHDFLQRSLDKSGIFAKSFPRLDISIERVEKLNDGIQGFLRSLLS
jgi:hypothetical protein